MLESSIVFLVFLWFLFFFNSKWAASILVIVFSFVLGIATQQKSIYRGEPLYPSDVYFLKDFTFLFDMVDIWVVLSIIIALIIVFVFMIVIFFKQRKSNKKRDNKCLVLRIAGLIVITVVLGYVYQFNQPDNKVKDLFNNRVSWISYSQEANYSQNGVVSGLLYNLQSPAVDRPEDYSQEAIKKIYDKYVKEAQNINSDRDGSLEDVNVIYVMSETFSDPLEIEGIKISNDPIPHFRNLTSQNIHGKSFSQGYGGGTANIEFEALTGISIEPLATNITTPFIQLSGQIGEFPTVLDYFENYKHELTAIHPYNTTMYKRLENYNSIGFDNSIFQEDMTYSENIDDNTFISDESAFNEVIDVLNKTQEKDFIHLVTMQNHKPYVNKYSHVDFEVSGAPYNLEVSHYAQGLQYSDNAFKSFLDKIDNLQEKTIVVFWGDHLPSFYGKELFDLNGHVTMHETPLLFYSNFEKDNIDIGTISPMHFFNHVLSISGEKVTPYTAMLQRMENILPALEKGFYFERETNIKNERTQLKPSTQLLLEEYDLILYDITTGENYAEKIGFY